MYFFASGVLNPSIWKNFLNRHQPILFDAAIAFIDLLVRSGKIYLPKEDNEETIFLWLGLQLVDTWSCEERFNTS